MNTSKQINVMVLLVFLTIVALIGYTLWDPLRAEEAEETQTEKAAERGAAIYAEYCRTCHGDVGEGGALADRLPEAVPHNRPDLQGRAEEGGPIDPIAKRDATKKVYNTIRCGRVGTMMPQWAVDQGGPLNDAQIEQLTTLIVEGRWDLAEEAAELSNEELGGPPPLPENPAITDNTCGQRAGAGAAAAAGVEPPPPSPGRDVFTGPVGCAACHTIAGLSSGTVGTDLTHIATIAATRVEGLSAEEYLRQSLEDPTVFLADDYPAAMPKLLESLSDQEYEELVQFLLSLE
jgi:mono/diheme cytochrome c family protein